MRGKLQEKQNSVTAFKFNRYLRLEEEHAVIVRDIGPTTHSIYSRSLFHKL